MRRIVPLALAAAALSLAVSQAHAGITFSARPIDVQADDTVILDPALATGYQGYVLSLNADAASAAQKGVVTVDFKTDPLELKVPIGIGGQIHQAWNIPATGPSAPTPSTEGDAVNLPYNGYVPGTHYGYIVDSMFLNQGYYNVSVAEPFTETSTGTGSPIADEPYVVVNKVKYTGYDYGVGSLMTFAGAASGETSQNSLDFAFVIVPKGGMWVAGYDPNAIAFVNGAALDASSIDKTKSFAIQASYVLIPEPASLGVLALGGMALMARRRRA